MMCRSEAGKTITRKKMTGDSGMSDSSFYKFQHKIQERMKKFTADTDKEIREKFIRERFKANTGKSKPTLWQRIKGFLNV